MLFCFSGLNLPNLDSTYQTCLIGGQSFVHVGQECFCSFLASHMIHLKQIEIPSRLSASLNVPCQYRKMRGPPKGIESHHIDCHVVEGESKLAATTFRTQKHWDFWGQISCWSKIEVSAMCIMFVAYLAILSLWFFDGNTQTRFMLCRPMLGWLWIQIHKYTKRCLKKPLKPI